MNLFTLLLLFLHLLNNNAFCISRTNILQNSRTNILQNSRTKILQNSLYYRTNILQNSRTNILQNSRTNILQNSRTNILQNSRTKIVLCINDTNHDDDDDFPSLDYIKKQNINEENSINYINSINYEKNNIHKDLIMITALSCIEWSKVWTYYMIHLPDCFPTFMYNDMAIMRDFARKNNSKQYLFIGYYPKTVDSKKGPFYIGAFEINPKKHELIAHIIIQNPIHVIDNNYDKEIITNFKIELEALSNDASVVFKFENLKSGGFERYYYSWQRD